MAEASSISLEGDPSLRWGVASTIPVNLAGAVLFSPLGAAARGIVGMAPIEPIYGAVLATWIFAIGLAFVAAWRARRVDVSLLAIACVGKLSFVIAMVVAALVGRGSWLAAAAAWPDLALAIVFMTGALRARA